jgi:Protein kinase domain/PEGA domain
VLTYGTNVEPRYFPYLRLAEASLALGQLDAAREALERSAAWGAREPAEERQALTVRLAAASAPKTAAPPPATATPVPVPPPATPAPTPTPTATPSATPEPPAPAALPPPRPLPPAASPLPSPRPRTADSAPPFGAAAPSKSAGNPTTGSLEVLSQPAGASVYLDDEPIGSTDPGTGRLVKSGLPPGRHRVRVSRIDHADATVEIEVVAGTTQTFRSVLSPLRAETDDGRAGLLAFALLAVVAVAAIAWLALRRAPADPARRVTQPSGIVTDSSGLVTPRALVNPGARVDTRGQEWFGEYRLLEALGRGGMASVYKAERRQEFVALKRPLGTLLDNPEFIDRFLREAEIGRTLNHPNIVRILERGNIEGVPYFTMELVAGETLLSYLGREGAAEPRFAARVVVQVAEALDFAHGKGVVHRDLKPSNIMLLPDGSARVMDFGIARAERFGTLTATSAFLGTPHYVAPEMIDGPGAEARSDLYALGVVFFELLTGTRPFVAETPFAILKKHCLEEPPPPSRVRPGVPPELDALVLQLLRKTPAERPAGAEALVIALRDFLRRAA